MTEETSGSISNTVSGEKLRSYVERLERIAEDEQAVKDDKKVVFAEAKSDGFDNRYIKAVIKLRAVSPSERQEHEAMMEMYQAAMGMSSEAPLFRHLQGMSRDAMAREAVIEALKLMVPEDAEITIRVAGGTRVRLWRDRDGVHAEDERPQEPDELVERTEKPSRANAKRRKEAPDCTTAEAKQLGREARKADDPVIANPFPWDDKRRRFWDEGWRDEDGGDGMGPS